MKYFYINNIKYNYSLEFNNKFSQNLWKHKVSLIEYFETLGIHIPHYCYHKSLSISGNCRMCLIELKNSPKPIVSCSLNAKSSLTNAEIYTNSPLVKKARENIMEFLLINHPLDCPICDQGGECDLQDQSLFLGFVKKRFYNYKRIVTNKNLGPIVKTVMTRCIHCTRCVRFSEEIAGTSSLGMFSRGVTSEVGTYINSFFNSELAGNSIDLCPVGALTAKPYPFVSRNWELKKFDSIDFSDGFGSDLKVFLKNNKIVKIVPNFSQDIGEINWISDKTRFFFDGLFSPDHFLKVGLFNNQKNCFVESNWNIIFNEIILILYFFDHINKHLYKFKPLYIVINNNLSIELLNLLNILSKKFEFIQLRKVAEFNFNNNLERDFLLNFDTSNVKLDEIDLLLLLGVNTRYESSFLNLKLRKRFLKGNLKVLSLSSILDLTFKNSYLGLNVNLIKNISEGTNFQCQNFVKNKSKTAVLYNSEFLKRKDSNGLIECLKSLNLNLNFLNLSLSESTLNYLNKYKTLNLIDLSNFTGLYFINVQNNLSILHKLMNLNLLNYVENADITPKIFINQNNGIINKFMKTLSYKLNFMSFINLPNSTFYETTGTYFNAKGFIKKNYKFLSLKKTIKEDWKIIRNLISSSLSINFSLNNYSNKTVFFSFSTFIYLKKYISFLYTASNNFFNLTNLFFSSTDSFTKIQNLYKNPKIKYMETKIQLWLNDFFLGGKDNISNLSVTMMKCSKVLREYSTNFILVNYVIF